MKVFISQPMRGYLNEEIEEQRAKAIEIIKRKHGDDVVILESFAPDVAGNKRAVEMLADSLTCMAQADVVYFLPDWEEARGCRVEYQVCCNYEIPSASLYLD